MTSEDKGITMTRELWDYLVGHSIPPTAQHAGIVQDTLAAANEWSIMQIPPEQGALMTLLARLVDARNAVEVGTFTGYSSLCIARGLADGGRLLCCDVSEEWHGDRPAALGAAGVADRIELRIGPALETLRALPRDDPIDLAFIDADKAGYIGYYEELVPRLRPGGLLLADNVLWSGRVVDDGGADDDTAASGRSTTTSPPTPGSTSWWSTWPMGLSLVRKR